MFHTQCGECNQRWELGTASTCTCVKNEPFKPDWDTQAVLVEEMQRMARRIEELEAMLERQTARIVDLHTHIENFDGEDR